MLESGVRENWEIMWGLKESGVREIGEREWGLRGERGGGGSLG